MKKISLLFIVSAALAFLAGCQKNNYFQDGGKHTPNYNGTILQYLNNKPGMFDSVSRVIQLAGMQDVFDKEEITFFAPADSSISNTIFQLNQVLRFRGRKEVTNLNQIKPTVWRRMLSRYIFEGKKSLTDYPQIDTDNLSAFPGQIYASYDGEIMNVGVRYNNAGGVAYAGYRQLLISFIPSVSSPRDYLSWRSAAVASVNIAPTNGYVHALQYTFHPFGFDIPQFIEQAIAAGID